MSNADVEPDGICTKSNMSTLPIWFGGHKDSDQTCMGTKLGEGKKQLGFGDDFDPIFKVRCITVRMSFQPKNSVSAPYPLNQ